MQMPFFIVGIVKERIVRVGSESRSKTRTKMGSGSEKNSFGSTTLVYWNYFVICHEFCNKKRCNY
jgi:low temperature requirement protein LtrA